MNANSRTPLFPEDVAARIDHTALKSATTEAEIRQLCREALTYNFASVCINPTWVALAAELLSGSPVRVCMVDGATALAMLDTGATRLGVSAGVTILRELTGERLPLLATTGGAY